MFRFFLFLKGYYLMKVSGTTAERFINLCKVKNIYLWDLKKNYTEYVMKISVADYKNLPDILNKTGVKVDILKKYGLPFLIKGKKTKSMYLVFVLVAILIVFISNLFVWNIKYEGNYSVSAEQLNDFLNNHGIKEGVMKIKIPYTVLEEELRKEFSLIKWCSVAISGNTLYVRIEENSLLDKEKENLGEQLYSNIIATEDGTINSILVRNGMACVKVGDMVKKGQILVTGAVPIYDDSVQIKAYHYYDADADIFMDTVLTYEDFVETVYYEKEYTGRNKKRKYFKINEWDIHFPFQPDFAYYDLYTSTGQMILFNRISMPIYYGVYEAREYYLKERKYTQEEVVDIFNKKLSNYYRSLSEKGVQILEKDVKIEHNASKWVINGNFVVSIKCLEKEYKEQQLEIGIQ